MEKSRKGNSGRLRDDLQGLWARQSRDFWDAPDDGQLAGKPWLKGKTLVPMSGGWRKAEDGCPDDQCLLVCWNRSLLACTFSEPGGGFSDFRGGVLPVPPGLDCHWRTIPGEGLAPLGGFLENAAALDLLAAAPAFIVRFSMELPPIICRTADSPPDGVTPLSNVRMVPGPPVPEEIDVIVKWDSVHSVLLLPEPPPGESMKDEG